MDISKAFESENGFVVQDGPFYTGGAASPVGLNLPESTLYLQTVAGGILLWRKFGTGVNDWRRLSAQDIPFVPVTGIAGTDSQSAVEAHVGRHNPNGPDAIATANVQTLTPDQANTEGIAGSVSRSDHVHNIPTAAAVSLGANSTNAQGASSSFSRSDHTHDLATGVVSTLNPDQANAEGASNNLARADHIHNIPTAAAVTLGANSTNTQGASTSFARADHTHDLSTGVVSTITPDQANAEGTSDNLARADHIHNIPAAIASTIGTDTANAEGAAASFARSDHTHEVNLPSSQAYASGNTTTTSATDVALNAMSITPGAGTYLVLFVTSLLSSSNNAVITTSIYANNAQVADTEINAIPRDSNSSSNRVPIMNVGTATVAGGQAIEIRWRTTGGTATAYLRKLQLVRIA